MTFDDRIIDFLSRFGSNYYCDACLSVLLTIPSLREVQQQTMDLAEEGVLKRSEASCVCCYSTKLVSKWRVSAYAA